MQNILSIDLESWLDFYKDALTLKSDKFEPSKPNDKNYIPCAVDNILEILKKYEQKATFFIIAKIYDWYPETIEKIQEYGHEIAYHTHNHLQLNINNLQSDIKESKVFLDRFKPKGFRAPRIYITKDCFKILKDNGFLYSSSSYNVFDIQKIDGIYEIPISTIPITSKYNKIEELPQQLSPAMFFKKIPFGSGLMVALLGNNLSFFIDRINKKNIPAILFLHPWQIYQPKEINSFMFKLKVLVKNPLCFIYTRNILKQFEHLLSRYKFVSFEDYFEFLKPRNNE